VSVARQVVGCQDKNARVKHGMRQPSPTKACVVSEPQPTLCITSTFLRGVSPVS
jgi:hypothetical protein